MVDFLGLCVGYQLSYRINAGAIGGGRLGNPRQSSIFRIASDCRDIWILWNIVKHRRGGYPSYPLIADLIYYI